MNTYNWYQIFNTDDFDEEGLISKEYDVNMVGVGIKSILVTKGFSYSIIYSDTLLTVDMGGNNPFEFGGYAIYQDADNNVWLGLPDS